MIQEHLETGYKLISCKPLLREVPELVRAHHKRFSRTGYSQKLQGEQIPLCARIFAVTDGFDEMTTQKPYQTARPISDATAENCLQAGGQVDPRVVGAFLDVPAEIFDRIHSESKDQQVQAVSGSIAIFSPVSVR